MRLSTIAVCLLLLTPCSVSACLDDHSPQQTGWFHEMPSSYRSSAGEGAEETTMPGLWMLGAGSASVALVVVSFRAFSRAAGRGPMQPTRPAGEDTGDRESQEFQMQDPEFRYV